MQLRGLLLVRRRRSPPKPVEEYKAPPTKAPPTNESKPEPELEDQLKELEDMSKSG